MRVLVVDDERNIRESIERYLAMSGLEVATAENGLAAQRLLRDEAFAAGIIDLRMPGMDGLSLLRWLRDEGQRLPVIMISAYGEIRDAVEAMKLGAEDYVVKPFDPEELVVRLKHILANRRLAAEVELGSRSAPQGFPELGQTARMRDLAAMVAKVADTPSTVLITGENGTGKEVVARRIHALSSRADAPFVAVNIGGIPETLLESELFGHERGAFTGAERRKIGMFELASSGSLFLDEIGDMPLHLQVKLLRVLQEKRIQRLGSTQPVPIDARFIAATHQDLSARVREGRFREDLFYRLAVVRLEVPPLRERLDDLPLLAGQILVRLNAKLGKAVRTLDPAALKALRAYPFPGNVRELENLLERAMIFADSDALGLSDLALPPAAGPPPPPPAASLESLERRAIAEALQRWEGNRTRAASELGISRRTLLNKIKDYGIES
jgi:two-component system response regulator AtoC